MGAEHLLRLHRQRDLLDLVAEGQQQLDRVVEHPAGIGIEGQAGQRLVEQRHAQLARIAADLVGEGALQRRQPVWAARFVALADVQQQRRVAHAARHHVGGTGAEPALETARTAGRAVAAGFEAEQTAVRRRNADRTAAVGGVGGRDDAGGHRRGRAARGAAGAVRQVPGVAGLPPQLRLGGGGQAELRYRRLAEGQRAGGLVTGDQGAGVLGGRGVLEEARAVAGRGAGQEGVEVLDQHGHAGQRALAGQPLAAQGRDPAASIVVVAHHHGIHLGIDRIAARQRGGQQLLGADRAAAHLLGHRRGVQFEVLGLRQPIAGEAEARQQAGAGEDRAGLEQLPALQLQSVARLDLLLHLGDIRLFHDSRLCSL
ncbi:hypothetical protein D3C85_215790 [compost metagenome]